ncbi:15565_t:CDS:2 [Cetraspora pellucida]|uniref:15565_t:CDS:1 n=1 Tax=Cetraspora pellucida TaxID=1433469 RepID=A0A9N8VHP5_9GLOM|nr:15565_t:CDS:2 [Cetraspora pellucida]
MKSFSIIAQARHINYINEKLNLKKPSINKPILITADEEQVQLTESSMKKEELILKKDKLLVILQQVQELTNNNEAD